MATVFVDSTASGANDGTSWTDAYTSLNTALTAANHAPGDLYLVSGTFNETVTIEENAGLSTPTRIFGDDKTGGSGKGAAANFTIDGQSTRTNCITASVSGTLGYSFENMICQNATGAGCNLPSADWVTFVNCQFIDNGAQGITADDGVYCINCISTGNTYGFDIDNGSGIWGCEAYANSTGAYITNGATYAGFNTAYGLGSGDVAFTLPSSNDYVLINNTVDGENEATTTGFSLTGGSARLRLFMNNLVHDCNTGISASNNLNEFSRGRNNIYSSCNTNESGFTTWYNLITTAASFEDEAGDDYTPASSGNALEAGFDGGEANQGASYIDIGAIQRQPTASGGTTGDGTGTSLGMTKI